ncbi:MULTISPECIES: hypothetical protein [unclassified Mesorhizobium]|uniref:hypothetical protein n=1 Tax=Mesorhizobium TaxID=68287 RepID=UPI0003CF0F28|nr:MULTISPECIES: hypothetical protein [unclassified Mesorhizobium]ESY91334.1 hypothetical protein X741_23875 [Mesorhizobium sp. LNHC229A00]ESY95912.1 hypothetical protein X738_21000 [Mesorhizobium sp. LNHC209A00]
MSFTAFQTNAFQNDAFQTVFQVPLYPGDGGRAGYYRRPLKYVRDGQVVDLSGTATPTTDEIIGSFELTPAIMAADLRSGLPRKLKSVGRFILTTRR